MSERVMSLIESMVPAAEVYSIDECFADLSGIQGDLTLFGRNVRSRVFQCTGIPVGVGIAGTKTLAKLANHTAKRIQAQTGGVVDITDAFKRDWVLRNTKVKRCGVLAGAWPRTSRQWASIRRWTWPGPMPDAATQVQRGRGENGPGAGRYALP